MKFESTFNYVFFDLKNVLGKLTIHFEHRMINKLGGGFPDYPSDVLKETEWSISITSFGGYSSFKTFESKFKEEIINTINYINLHRIELHPFFTGFTQQIRQKVETFKKIHQNNRQLDINDFPDVTLTYNGALSLIDCMVLHHLPTFSQKPNLPPQRNTSETFIIIKEAKRYFAVLINELERLLAAIEHENNLSQVQSNVLSAQNKNHNLINLIKKAELTKFFNELEKIPEFQYREDVIHLSSKFYSLEKDKNKGIIKREEYDLEKSKIISSLISIIARNVS